MDIAHGELVEKELEAFIEKRSRKEPKIDAREELWKASVRRYNVSKEAERRVAWSDYHRGQAERLRRTMERLAAVHERQAIKLLEGNQQ
jgi:hypothetical protein